MPPNDNNLGCDLLRYIQCFVCCTLVINPDRVGSKIIMNKHPRGKMGMAHSMYLAILGAFCVHLSAMSEKFKLRS